MDVELINEIMNIVVPSITLITILLVVLPPLLLYRLVHSFFKFVLAQNVAGKVVLVTGASSGIGQHVAYEYAKRGARLALVARRLSRLQEVAETARYLGSPDVIVIPADVTRAEDCRRFIHQAINHFGRLDHLVNNAGIATKNMLEELTDVTNALPVMDTNFWGSVYAAHHAIPYLRSSRGKIIVTASAGAWLPVPRLAIYSASKAAVISFFETLQTELGGDIGITIVTPGVIESEMTKGKFLSEEGEMVFDQEIRDVHISIAPVLPVEKCATAIVNSACRGDAYLTVPSWIRVTWWWKVVMPEVLEWCNRMLLITRPGTPPTEAPTKKLLDYTGAKSVMWPRSIQCRGNKDHDSRPHAGYVVVKRLN